MIMIELDNIIFGAKIRIMSDRRRRSEHNAALEWPKQVQIAPSREVYPESDEGPPLRPSPCLFFHLCL